MTNNEFDQLCQKYLIDPCIAIENENIVSALQGRNDAEIETILKNEF